MAAKQAAAAAGAQNNAKFLVLPVVILLMAQMGTSGENSALGLANLELVSKLGATVPDIQLANMVYSLIAGAFMVAGGLLGTVIGWKRNFRMGALLCALGEIVMAFSPNMTVLIWGGRVLVGLGASFMIPSVLGLVPKIYHGKNRVQAYGCIGAASGLAAVLPLIIGMLMENAGFRFTYIVLGCYFLLVLLLSFKLPAIEKVASAVSSTASARALPPLVCSCSSSVCRVFRYGASPRPSPRLLSPSSVFRRRFPWSSWAWCLSSPSYSSRSVSRRRRAARFFLRRS